MTALPWLVKSFEESKHPRADDGKFGSGGGSHEGGKKRTRKPKAKPAPPPPGYGNDTDHPLQGTRSEQERQLFQARSKAEDGATNALNHESGPPKGLDMNSFGHDVRQAIASKTGGDVGLTTKEIYDEVGIKHNLSKQQFNQAVVALHNDTESALRLGGWSRSIDELDDLQLAPLVSSKVMGYVQPGPMFQEKIEADKTRQAKALALPWLVTKQAGSFSGVSFGKYFINGQQVDKATYLAQQGNQKPKAPTPKQAAKQADPADVLDALAAHPEVQKMGLTRDHLAQMQLSQIDDMAKQLGIGVKPPKPGKPAAPQATPAQPATQAEPPPLPQGRTAEEPPPLPNRQGPPPLPNQQGPPRLSNQPAVPPPLPQTGPPPLPGGTGNQPPPLPTRATPPPLPHNRTHQAALAASNAVGQAKSPAERHTAHKAAIAAIDAHASEGMKHIDRLARSKYPNDPQKAARVAVATKRAFHEKIMRARKALAHHAASGRRKGIALPWITKAYRADELAVPGLWVEKAAKSGGKGRWITIGGKKGGDGKRSGGSPVYVENGRITRGHPSLTGKKIDNLGGDSEDGSHRSQLAKSRSHAHAKRRKAAKTDGHNPDHVEELANDIRKHHNAEVSEHNDMLKYARSYWGDDTGFGRRRGEDGYVGGKQDGQEGMDLAAASTRNAFPGRFKPENGEHGSHEDQLVSMLQEGNREQMSHDDAWDQALEHFENERGGAITTTDAGDYPSFWDDPIEEKKGLALPWLGKSLFDESDHPRDADGKFGSGGGGEPAKKKPEYVRAPSGGKVSDVDGKHYRGGQLMPIHGLYSGMEKPKPKDTGLVSNQTPANEDSEGKGKRQPPQPMTPEEIAAKHREAGEQKMWDEMNAGPLGKLTWLGSKPNSAALKSGSTVLDKFKEFVDQHGPETAKKIVDALEPQYHRSIERQGKRLRDEHQAKVDAGTFNPTYHRKPDDDFEEYYKSDVQRRAKDMEDTFKRSRKSGMSKVPHGHYARELIDEFLHSPEHFEDNPSKLEAMYRINQILVEATRKDKVLREIFAAPIYGDGLFGDIALQGPKEKRA